MNGQPPTEPVEDPATGRRRAAGPPGHLAPELLDEVSHLLSDIAYDRIHLDIRPEGTLPDPDWLRKAAAAQYGLLGEALEDRR